jgi:lamin tail-like protein
MSLPVACPIACLSLLLAALVACDGEPRSPGGDVDGGGVLAAIHLGGTVQGPVAIGGAPGGAGIAEVRPLPDLLVNADFFTAYSDGDGVFTIEAESYNQLSSSLKGRAVTVAVIGAMPVTATATPQQGVVLTMAGDGSELALAQVTVYYYMTMAYRFMHANGIPIWGQVAATLRGSGCGADYSPIDRSFGFAAGDAECQSSAEASLIAHEYGQFVDDAFGGITDFALGEGWGDLVACYLLKQPVIGGDLYRDGSNVRRCDNDYVYNPGGTDAPQLVGQAWSGFAWHLREGLIAALGEADGEALARALVLPSLTANAADIPAALREVFLRDDDDGDLSNGTRHWSILLAAADRHGLGFIVNPDLTPPAPVTDLTATVVDGGTIQLRWTAPGDDGHTGTASSYQLHYASKPITASSFDGAAAISTGAPSPAGQLEQSWSMPPPGAGTVYYALRSVDDSGNVSAISNVAQATLPQPPLLWSEGFEGSTSDWQASGLWHVTQRRAAVGSHSFWYGRESTGNYDTGHATAGVLTSPIIDLAGVVSPRLLISQFIDVQSGFDDTLRIRVTDVADPAVSLLVDETAVVSGGFTFRLIELNAVVGRRVRVSFEFDSPGWFLQPAEGWYIDQIRVFSGAATPVPTGTLLVNEVLADPPVGYDANGDGAASATADEFIELFNPGPGAVTLAGATLSDGEQVRFTFPTGAAIPAGGVLVVFGGGSPQIQAPFLVAGALSLNNGGDTVRIVGPDGTVLAQMTYGAAGGQDASLVRQIDGDPGSLFVRHVTVSTSPASPGRRSDGTPFGEAAPPQILVNEILADPPAGYDASGDGVASTTQDELVELVNIGAASIDLSGATLSDGASVRATMPAGTVIAPGKVLLVFGGAAVGLSLPGVTIVSQGTLSLNNGGDTVTLRSAGGVVLASATYGPEGGQDASLVRTVDASAAAPFARHDTLAVTPASPGRRIDGTLF